MNERASGPARARICAHRGGLDKSPPRRAVAWSFHRSAGMTHGREIGMRTLVLALAAATLAGGVACRRSNAADAGGDSALARDLAVVQMETNAARDSVARAARAAADSSLAPAESLPASVTPPPAPSDSTAMVTVAEPESTTAIPAKTPAATTTASASAPSATTHRAPVDPCTSPAASSQRTCLRVRLAAYDARLNRVYGRYIARLRSAPANRGGGAPAIRKLRESERAWVKYRDAMCARKLAGKEGKLWAPARAECLGQYANERARLLEGMLAKR